MVSSIPRVCLAHTGRAVPRLSSRSRFRDGASHCFIRPRQNIRAATRFCPLRYTLLKPPTAQGPQTLIPHGRRADLRIITTFGHLYQVAAKFREQCASLASTTRHPFVIASDRAELSVLIRQLIRRAFNNMLSIK